MQVEVVFRYRIYNLGKNIYIYGISQIELDYKKMTAFALVIFLYIEVAKFLIWAKMFQFMEFP